MKLSAALVTSLRSETLDRGDCDCEVSCFRLLHRVKNPVTTTNGYEFLGFPDKPHLNLSHVSRNVRIKGLWRCPTCTHEFLSPVGYITSGMGCSACSGKVIVAGINDFASSDWPFKDEWSQLNEKRATEISRISCNLSLWSCRECNSYWRGSVNDRINGKVSCQVCSDTKVKRGYNDLLTTHPEVAATWSLNNELSPTEVTARSSKRLLWICASNHEYRAAVKHRATNSTSGCGVCNGKIVIAGVNDVASLYPELIASFSSKNVLKLDQLAPSSNKVAIWECEEGHEWSVRVANRTFGHGCPTCARNKSYASKEEQEFAEYVKSLGVVIERNDLDTLGGREIDVWIPSRRIGIEYNGRYWHSFPASINNDKYKHIVAADRDLLLLTVWDTDWRDRKDAVKQDVKELLVDNVAVSSLSNGCVELRTF